jgi:hypothetical protein
LRWPLTYPLDLKLVEYYLHGGTGHSSKTDADSDERLQKIPSNKGFYLTYINCD